MITVGFEWSEGGGGFVLVYSFVLLLSIIRTGLSLGAVAWASSFFGKYKCVLLTNFSPF